MSNVYRFEIEKVSQEFPLGTVAGDWQIQIQGVGANTFDETRTSPDGKFEFVLEVGSYVATAFRLDADAVELGDGISVPFDVIADAPTTVVIDVPAGLLIVKMVDVPTDIVVE